MPIAPAMLDTSPPGCNGQPCYTPGGRGPPHPLGNEHYVNPNNYSHLGQGPRARPRPLGQARAAGPWPGNFVEEVHVLSNFCRTYVELLSNFCRTYVELLSNFCRIQVRHHELMSNFCRTFVESRSGIMNFCRTFVESLSTYTCFGAEKGFLDFPGRHYALCRQQEALEATQLLHVSCF